MLTTYHHPMPLSRNLGTLTSWNPLGLSRPVMGLIYLFTELNRVERKNVFVLCKDLWPAVKRSLTLWSKNSSPQYTKYSFPTLQITQYSPMTKKKQSLIAVQINNRCSLRLSCQPHKLIIFNFKASGTCNNHCSLKGPYTLNLTVQFNCVKKNTRKTKLNILLHSTGFPSGLSVSLSVLCVFLCVWLWWIKTRMFASRIGHNVIRKEENLKCGARTGIWKGIYHAMFICWMNC